VHAEVVGYGNAFEPPESEALLVHVSPSSVERAIRMAMADAGVIASEISVVASAASGISHFDVAELVGIEAVLGAKVPIAAPKAIFGETFGAAGAFGMACALAWFEGVPVWPLITGTAPKVLDHVLVVAVGYYGNASAVILRSPR
jgi:3-oxoacyl-[acyl-carrier-protein] synthase II